MNLLIFKVIPETFGNILTKVIIGRKVKICKTLLGNISKTKLQKKKVNKS